MMGVRIYHQPLVRGKRTAYSAALRFLSCGLLGLEPGDLRLLRNPKHLAEFIRSIDYRSACAMAFLTRTPRPNKSEMQPVGLAGWIDQLHAHPGEILWRHHIRPLRMSITAAAAHIGVSRQTLAALVKCQRPVTVEMARRLAKAFSTSSELWTNLQQNYDLTSKARWDRDIAEHAAAIACPSSKNSRAARHRT